MAKPPHRSFLPSLANEQPGGQAADAGRPEMSVTETAEYISEFSAVLSSLAREAKLDLLAYLLDMARLEAVRVREAPGEDR
ncbi:MULTISPECIES: hypothetical protein [Microvirga]|uniref:hypothetical protein n=1 Tax=Microvirga TaxID=186650 RepID=UPI0021CAA123|nr:MULTISPECIES: hypothetical protein [unclassified Microvirga]